MSQIQKWLKLKWCLKFKKCLKSNKCFKFKKCLKFKKCSKIKKCLKLKKKSQILKNISNSKNVSMWPIKNDQNKEITKSQKCQNARSDGTAWAPKARMPMFGPLCIRPTILPFLCYCPFLVSMFEVGLCVLWVLCGPSKVTARCYTSICDGIIFETQTYLTSFGENLRP